MKKQNGFTLIELVIVIVILGILAITAAPKFLNLQDDARIATLKGLQGAMKSAAGIVYGKAAIKGVETSSSSSVTVNGDTIETVYGYPAAAGGSSSNIATGIELAVEGLNREQNPEFDILGNSMASPATITYGYTGFGCQVKYTESSSSSEAPIIELISTDTALDDTCK